MHLADLRIFLVSGLSLILFTLNAQDDSDGVEILDSVIVSGRESLARKKVLPQSLINSKDIRLYSPEELNQSLNQVSGLYIQSGAINTNRIVIRGIGSRTLYGTNKVKAYLNGIPITNGVGESAINQYNTDYITTIDIIKGPKGTLYGTSLGGTILLESAQPGDSTIEVSNETTIGSYGLFKNSLTFQYANDQFSLLLNYGHMGKNGWRENSEYKRNSVLITPAYRFSEKTELRFLFNFIGFLAEIPSSINETTFRNDPRQAADNWAGAEGFEDDQQILTGLTLNHRFSQDLKNTTSLFYNYNDHYEPRPFNILVSETRGMGARSVFDFNFKLLGLTSTLAAGSEFFYDEYDWQTFENNYQSNSGNGSIIGPQLSENTEDRLRFDAFSSLKTEITKKLIIDVGINYNMVNYQYTDLMADSLRTEDAERNFEPFLAPSFTAAYLVGKNDKIYINASRGVNYPSLEETLNPDGIINPKIGPETGWNYEAGTELIFFNEELRILATVYLMSIDGLLVAERTGEDQYIGRNAGKTTHRGVEIAISDDFWVKKSVHFQPFVNLSYNDHEFTDFVDDGEDYSGNDLTGVPDWQINAGMRVENKSGIYISPTYQHVGSMPMNDENSLYSDAYSIFNLRAGFQVQLSEIIEINLYGGLQNLGDEKYASSILINAIGFGGSEPRYYYPGLPRNYYGGVRLNLKIR